MSEPTAIRLTIDNVAANQHYMRKSLGLSAFCDLNSIPMDHDVYDFDFLEIWCKKEVAVAKYAPLELECIRAAIAANGKAIVAGKWLVTTDVDSDDGVYVPNEIVVNGDDTIDMLFDDQTVAMLFKLRMGSLN